MSRLPGTTLEEEMRMPMPATTMVTTVGEPRAHRLSATARDPRRGELA
jgi:hypothetical protein